MDEQSKKICDLDEAGFLSFLYSERDRENSLSQLQGWNNWALVGAFVASLCAGFSTIKDSNSFLWTDLLFFSDGFLSYFLIFHSWWGFLTKRERGVDFSKVRVLKEVAPFPKIAFGSIIASISSVLMFIINGTSLAFWSWIAVLVIMLLLIVFVPVLGERLVPSFFEELYLPWIWGNVVFVTILSATLSFAAQQSFKMTKSGILSDEFFASACVTVCLIVAFVIFSINTRNRSVKQFDKILDDYLYLGVSKSNTIHSIIKNRMGYGVLDACERELKRVSSLIVGCENDKTEVEALNNEISKGYLDPKQMRLYQKKAKIALKNAQKALCRSRKLAKRVEEIIRVASTINEGAELEMVLETNNGILEKNKEMTNSITEMIRLLDEKISNNSV